MAKRTLLSDPDGFHVYRFLTRQQSSVLEDDSRSTTLCVCAKYETTLCVYMYQVHFILKTTDRMDGCGDMATTRRPDKSKLSESCSLIVMIDSLYTFFRFFYLVK